MDDRAERSPRKARKVWLPFEKARAWARSQGLTSETDWRRRRKLGLPEGVPTNPNRTYAESWNGWRDFLGLDFTKYSTRAYRSLHEASQWALSQGITSLKEWRQACAEDRIPHDIPWQPWRAYTDWTSAPSFFCQSERRTRNRAWRPYEQAREWVRTFGIVSNQDWQDALRRGDIPSDIPANPNSIYADSGWKGWPAFLGRFVRGGSSLTEDVIAHELSHFTKVDPNVRSIMLPNRQRKRVDIVLPEQGIVIEYDGAHWHRKTVGKDMLANESLASVGWTVVRVRELPLKPLGALDVVVDAGWTLIRKTAMLLRQLQIHGKLPGVSLGDIGRYESGGRLYAASTGLANVVGWRSLADAMAWARQQGVDSETKWRELRQSGSLPRDIPSNPDLVYAVNWVSWGEFLSTGREAVRSEGLVDYETAKAWARQSGIRQAREWTRANKARLLPPGIPGTPSSVYAEQWEGWGIFLDVSDDPKRRRRWRSFEETRQWARHLALKNGVDSERIWREFLGTAQLPSDIPRSPDFIYRDQWVSWGDFFGTGNGVGGAARWRKERAKAAPVAGPGEASEKAVD